MSMAERRWRGFGTRLVSGRMGWPIIHRRHSFAGANDLDVTRAQVAGVDAARLCGSGILMATMRPVSPMAAAASRVQPR